MNLKNLSDQVLLSEADRLATQSRSVLMTLLHHLREIERRRLFSTLKFESLFAYVVKRLKFSENEANRRISAMRMIREVPEIELRLSSGSLTLSNVVLARTLFGKEKKAGRPMAVDAKAQVMLNLENKSTREAQKYLGTINPEMKITRQLNFSNIEDEALRQKLLQVKGRFAHSNPNMTLTELLHRLCDQELEKKIKSPAAKTIQCQSAPSAQKVKPTSQAEIHRQIWRRDQARCSKCGSTHALERDHITPKSAGGADTSANQRLLCRNCNQRAAIEYFGMGKMGQFLKSPVIPYISRHNPTINLRFT
jgi:5-methylcytosine-specific restriction endonuclease McrA